MFPTSHHCGNFPQTPVGIKFLKSSLEWHCYYISPQTGDAAHIQYCTPIKGVPICLTQDLMTSSFFEQTAAVKMLALEITDFLNCCQDTITKVLIAPMVCECEREIADTQKNKMKTDNPKPK